MAPPAIRIAPPRLCYRHHYQRVPCRANHSPRHIRRIEEAAPRQVEKFSGAHSDDERDFCEDRADDAERPPSAGDEPVAVDDSGEVVLALDGDRRRLSRAEARALHDALGRALTATREFVRTTGEHRSDGSYVVSRRGATSTGHSKVFDRFEALVSVFEALPREFTADDVAVDGVTGGRRHMLVHHLAEHPAFDCELVRHQPLTARKTGDEKR